MPEDARRHRHFHLLVEQGRDARLQEIAGDIAEETGEAEGAFALSAAIADRREPQPIWESLEYKVAWLTAELGFDAFFPRPVALGRGWAEMAHGRFPVPPPAVLKLLQGIPVRDPESRRRVGYLPEGHKIPNYLTARQALSIFGRMSGVDNKTIQSRMMPWSDSGLPKATRSSAPAAPPAPVRP